MKHQIIFTLTILILSFNAFGQNLSSYDGKSPEKLLLENFFDTTSTTEKVIVRSYLQGKYPLSAEGMFSKAWLASYEDKTTEAMRLYKECLAKYPNFLPALHNLPGVLTGKENIQEKIVAYENLLSKDASFNSYSAIRFAYFIYRDDLSDKQKADEFLKRWEQKIGSDVFIFDFVRGLHTQYGDRDFRQAEQFYLRAIEKEGKSFEVYERLTNLRLRELSTNETSSSVRVGYLDIVKEYATKNPSSDAPLIYLGDVAKDIFKSNSAALEFYSQAFRRKPTAETAIKIYSLMRELDWAGTSKEPWNFLVKANEILPNNHKLLNEMAYRTADTKLAEQYFQEAIQNSYTLRDETINARDLAWDLYKDITFEYEKSEKLYRTYLSKGGDKNILLIGLYQTLKNSGKFRAAETVLNELESFQRANGDINEAYFTDRHREIEGFINREEKAANYYRDNPFLQHWQTTYGKSYKFSINFVENSDQIPSSDTEKLAQLSRVLSEKGADSYIFSIEGHTDSSETSNKTLSLRRADAIVAYLNRVHKIPLERLKSIGYGSENLIVPESLDGARNRNRRIEVVPIANINKQTLITTAALNTDTTFAISPDGNYLAVGNAPMQLWDARLKIKIRDFGRGGGVRKFSPDGRYLATASNFREVGGSITTALLIYDVQTGQVVAQNPLGTEIDGFDWNPFSNKIALAMGNARLIIYDLEQKRNIKSVRMLGNNYPRGVLWSKDDKYLITAQSRESEMTVWNVADLTVSRKLSGVDWAHGIAQTGNGKYIAAADNKGVMSVWDTATWTLKQQRMQTVGKALVAHPTKPIFVLPGWGGGENQPVVMANFETNQMVRNNQGLTSAFYQFSPDGAKIYQIYQDRIEVLDSTNWNEIDDIQGTAVIPFVGYTDKKNGYYLSADELGIHVWNTQNGRKIFAFNKPNVNRLVKLRSSEDQFIAVFEDRNSKQTQVFLLNTTTRQEKMILNLSYDIDRIVSTDSLIAFGGKPFVPNNTGSKEGFFEIYDRNSMTLKNKITIPFVTDYLKQGLNGSGFQAADINPKSNEIAVSTYWLDGFGTGTTYSKEARIFNLSSGELVRTIKPNEEIRNVFYPSNHNYTSTYDLLGITYSGGTWLYQTKSGEYVRRDNFRTGESRIWLADGKNYVTHSLSGIFFFDTSGKQTRKLNFDDNLQSVAIDENRNLLIAMLTTNEIVYYNLSDFQQKLTIISMKDNEWMAYSPNGEINDSSERGTDRIFVSKGDKMEAAPRRKPNK